MSDNESSSRADEDRSYDSRDRYESSDSRSRSSRDHSERSASHRGVDDNDPSQRSQPSYRGEGEDPSVRSASERSASARSASYRQEEDRSGRSTSERTEEEADDRSSSPRSRQAEDAMGTNEASFSNEEEEEELSESQRDPSEELDELLSDADADADRKEEEEKARLAAERKRNEEEEKAKIAAEQKHKEEEERTKVAAEQKLKEEEEERARIAAEQKLKEEEEERARVAAEQKLKEDKARKAAEKERIKDEEKRARIALEMKNTEDEEKARNSAEQKQKEAEEVKARVFAEKNRKEKTEGKVRIAPPTSGEVMAATATAKLPPKAPRGNNAKKPTATFVAADSVLKSDQFDDHPGREFSTGPLLLDRNEAAAVDLTTSQPFQVAADNKEETNLKAQDGPTGKAASLSPVRSTMDHDLDSLDGRSFGSGRGSRTTRTSQELKRMAAPGRPPKFASRPTHVHIRPEDYEVDSSLRGVIEGTKSYRHANRRSQEAKIMGPLADGVEKSKNNRSGFQSYVGIIAKTLLALAFFGCGAVLMLSTTGGGGGSGGAFKSGSPTSRSYGERDGEHAEAFLTNHGVIEMNWEKSSHEVHVSHDSDEDINQRVQELEAIILQHQVSLPETLDGSDPSRSQAKAVQWLAETSALYQSETSDDVQHDKLLQGYALAVFYYSLGGDVIPEDNPTVHESNSVHVLSPNEPYVYQGWYRKAKWMSHSDVCTWFGITCDRDGMVESLNLTRNTLKGAVPILELYQTLRGSLRIFDISHNGGITGKLSLPKGTEIEPWLQMEYFFVNDNALTGNVPSFSWFSGSPVKGINFAWNQFSGNVPSITDIEHLKMLYLSHNSLQGTLPLTISNLPKLDTLHINNNELVGILPRQWFELPSVVEFDAGSNSFTGNVPLVLPLMSNLEVLRLDENELAGPIPNFLDSLPKLRELALNNNTLSGTLPLTVGSLTNMEKLFLQENSLSGPIPSEVAAMTKLESLLLYNNNLYGSIPIDLCRLKAGFFNFNHLYDLEADCQHQIICDCCDKCY